MMTNGERVAYLIGWLAGFPSTVWTMDPERVSPETMGAYEDVVCELEGRVLNHGEGDDAE